MKELDFGIGASVRCQDGEAGKLAYLVTDQEGLRLTDLIVERGIPLISREARVVPFELVKDVSEETVWLFLKKDEFSGCQHYQETVVKVPEPVGGARFTPTGEYGTAPALKQRLRQGVAANKLLIGHATQVTTLNTTLGQVDRFIVTPEEGRLTHVVVSKGLLRRDYPVIPIEMVEEVGEESILVSVTSKEVEALPRYQK
jgi:sporulation protein YlmC with PRC-barrel domain